MHRGHEGGKLMRVANTLAAGKHSERPVKRSIELRETVLVLPGQYPCCDAPTTTLQFQERLDIFKRAG